LLWRAFFLFVGGWIVDNFASFLAIVYIWNNRVKHYIMLLWTYFLHSFWGHCTLVCPKVHLSVCTTTIVRNLNLFHKE
jgi:hypothetical protein